MFAVAVCALTGRVSLLIKLWCCISKDQALRRFTHLTLAQIYAALAYYHANREEIETELTADSQETALTGLSEKERWLEAFKELQRRLNLTPAKAAEWQDAVREARR
jgi:regulator of sirC expression with transglutaminase-like and TPR domain